MYTLELYPKGYNKILFFNSRKIRNNVSIASEIVDCKIRPTLVKIYNTNLDPIVIKKGTKLGQLELLINNFQQEVYEPVGNGQLSQKKTVL